MLTWIIIGLGIIGIGSLIISERRAGANAEVARQGVENAKAAERIADATAASPRTLDELSERLRTPSGKL